MQPPLPTCIAARPQEGAIWAVFATYSTGGYCATYDTALLRYVLHWCLSLEYGAVAASSLRGKRFVKMLRPVDPIDMFSVEDRDINSDLLLDVTCAALLQADDLIPQRIGTNTTSCASENGLGL